MEDREEYSWQKEQQHSSGSGSGTAVGLKQSEWAEAGQEVERQWGAGSWEGLGLPRG